MIRAVAYLRVSKEEEDIKNQELAIKKFAREEGFKIKKDEFFKEINVSGWTTQILDRRVFRELLEYTQKTDIKNIIIYDVTRFGRDSDDVITTYKYLEGKGYKIRFVVQKFLYPEFFENMFKLNGEWIINKKLARFFAKRFFKEMLEFFASTAEMESLINSIRTHDGLAKVKMQGRQIGKVPYGYRKIWINRSKKQYKIEIVPEEAQIILSVYRLMLDEGYGRRKIAHILGIPEGLVRSIMENEKYTGYMIVDGRIIKSELPPIVPMELYCSLHPDSKLCEGEKLA